MTFIACVQIPNVAIAVTQRDDPALAEQPVVLYAADQHRTIVTAASSDSGLAAGTPLRQAVVRCPHAVYRPIDQERARRVVADLVALLHAFSPRVAAASLTPDTQIDLDLGCISIPQTMALTQRLARHIKVSLGLTPALGVATTRFVAQRAAHIAGIGAAALVPAGCEATFLAPHAVTALPIDDATIHRLQLLGLHTIGALARLPLDALQAQFGGIGRVLHQLARGGDHTPITANTSPPTLTRTARFATGLTNRTLLEIAISRLVDRLVAQLHAGGWAARAITMSLTLDSDAPWNIQRTLRTPTADRALLAQAFLALSRTALLDTGIEALTLQITHLAPTVAAQLDLFAPSAGQAKQLEYALDRLRARYARSFVRARLIDPAAQVPEQRVRFDPWEPA